MDDGVRRSREPRKPPNLYEPQTECPQGLTSTREAGLQVTPVPSQRPQKRGADSPTSPDRPIDSTTPTEALSTHPESILAFIYRTNQPEGSQSECIEGEQADELQFEYRIVPERMGGAAEMYDILTSRELISKPLPSDWFHAFPQSAQNQLLRVGHLRAVFLESPDGDLLNFTSGWVANSSNRADVLANLLRNFDDAFAPSVYYFLHQEASEGVGSVEAIAEMRKIKQSTVVEGINQTKNRLASLSPAVRE